MFIEPHRQIWILGFGAVGSSLGALLIHQGLAPTQLRILSASSQERSRAQKLGLDFECVALTPMNLCTVLTTRLKTGDYLINLSVGVSSMALIQWCQQHRVLYLDTCVEPWDGGYSNPSNPEFTTNAYLRHAALALHRPGAPTAVIAHGANPGLVSHFVKVGLREMARRSQFSSEERSDAELARALGIQCIQIAESDTQRGPRPLPDTEIGNTWSVPGFLAEAQQRAELGWGTHEKSRPSGSQTARFRKASSIYLAQAGWQVRVRSWTPRAQEGLAYLITHHEAISIAEHLSVMSDNAAGCAYRPTVYYAYRPCPDLTRTLERARNEAARLAGEPHPLLDELTEGHDELGVLFVTPSGSFWYGSTVSLEFARSRLAHTNATTQQVVAGIYGALYWMSLNPEAGVVEAENMDAETVLRAAKPYLGEVSGVWTNWRPGPRLDFAAFWVE